MKYNLIQEKSFAFAIRIVNAHKFLVARNKEYVISKQLLRCGTSIAANIEEAIGAQSAADFISKLSISYKESREASFWIKLLYATGYLDDKLSKSLSKDIEEIKKIIAKILITSKEKRTSS